MTGLELFRQFHSTMLRILNKKYLTDEDYEEYSTTKNELLEWIIAHDKKEP